MAEPKRGSRSGLCVDVFGCRIVGEQCLFRCSNTSCLLFFSGQGVAFSEQDVGRAGVVPIVTNFAGHIAH